MRAALINTKTKIVENVIEYDPKGDFQIPAEYSLVISDTANIKDEYINKNFIRSQLPSLIVLREVRDISASNIYNITDPLSNDIVGELRIFPNIERGNLDV